MSDESRAGRMIDLHLATEEFVELCGYFSYTCPHKAARSAFSEAQVHTDNPKEKSSIPAFRFVVFHPLA